MPTHHGIIHPGTRKVTGTRPILGPRGEDNPLTGARVPVGGQIAQFDVPRGYDPRKSYKLPEGATELVERTKRDMTPEELLTAAKLDPLAVEQAELLRDLAGAAGLEVPTLTAALLAKASAALGR